MPKIDIDAIELIRRDQVIKGGKHKGLLRYFESVGFSDCLVDAELERTIEGASTLTLQVVDPQGVIANLEEFQTQASLHPTEIRVLNQWFALAGISKGDDGMLSITFEDREVNVLRRYRGPRKSKRARQTRAEFCAMLVSEASVITDRRGKFGRIEFVSPELGLRQIIGTEGETAASALESDSGFPAGIRLKFLRRTFTVLEATKGSKNVPAKPRRLKWKNEIRVANKTQLNYLDKVFKECRLQKATKPVYQAAAVLAMSGSNLWNTGDEPGKPPGNLFGLKREGRWKVSAGTDAQLHLKKLIPVVVKELVKRNKTSPKLNGLQLAEKVTGRSQKVMRPWWPYAQNAVKEWKFGVNRRTDAYEFTRGEPNGERGESTWDAINRMATEVGWRCWCDEGKVYFASDEYLASRPSSLTIKATDEAITGISWSQEGGEIPSECSVSLLADVLDVYPGSPITVEGEGPADGAWLIKSVSQSIFSDEASVTLSRPQPKLAEPRGEIGALAVSGGRTRRTSNTTRFNESTGVPDRIKRMIAKANTMHGKRYSQGPDRVGPNAYDCSSAVSTILHAGGFVKNKSGFTAGGLDNGQGTNGFGVSGRGKYFTVHSSGGAGNSGHTWIVFEKASGIKGAPRQFEYGGRNGSRGWTNNLRRDRPARHAKGW